MGCREAVTSTWFLCPHFIPTIPHCHHGGANSGYALDLIWGSLHKGPQEPLGLMLIRALELCWLVGPERRDLLVCLAGG